MSPTMAGMNDRISPYPIRPPAELREKLEEAAQANNRSLHAEIIGRLERSFEMPPAREAIPEPTAIEMLQDLIDQQRTVSSLTFLLQDAVDLLEDSLPDDLRQNPDFSAWINQAEATIHEIKLALRASRSQ